MASATTSRFGSALFNDDGEHPVWNSFSEVRRQSLVEDDLQASRSVAAVLIGVVTFGVLLGATAVLIACL